MYRASEKILKIGQCLVIIDKSLQLTF